MRSRLSTAAVSINTLYYKRVVSKLESEVAVIQEKEKRLSETKKQIPLRLSSKLYNELAAWAEDEFRSINGQIEYLLTECVKKRKAKKEDS